jgi:tetratricopeptide (TPR) repeat protein/predicted Ser/Thr protein kinase
MPEPAFSVRDYRILQPLASGGMGEVYEAEQQRPVRRHVALKVIKLGMDTREVVARFESERQALALMNHPNIAGVYDAGATDQGRPFFAMEFVRGEPITTHCDRLRLTVRERLELFLDVCSGVQHAHQKGIIHRDIKPSNVLVTVQDDRSVAKIIDFGVAKAISQSLTDKTMVTELGSVIGTPEYMSPEQAESTSLDVDTRTDVYSLGMLLYELLAGALPFDPKALRKGGLAAIQRFIREQEPPRPSSRLESLGTGADAIARNRGLNVSGLVRRLRGDLDWIILKALEKDRTRRYETANALAFDIRRHLEDEPVSAGAPTTIYRARKFIRRHRAGVVSLVLLGAVLIAGIIGTTIGLLRAVRAEQRASQDAETARQVSEFLVDLFRLSDPEQAKGQTITARAILDAGAKRVETELDDQPVTQARMMDTIGTVYENLGLYEAAEPLLRQAVATRERYVGPESLELADSLLALGTVVRFTGEYAEAEALCRRSLEIREFRLGPNDPRVADVLVQIGWARARQGRSAEAATSFRRALEIRETSLGPEHPAVAESLTDLGILSWRRGEYDAAVPMLERALAIFERSLEPDAYEIRKVLHDLAVVYSSQARFEEAKTLYERALAIRERVLGPEHPEVGSTLNNLALLLDAQQRPEEAQPKLERALAIFQESFGPDHEKTALALHNLAWVHYQQGNYEQSSTLYDRALDAYERSVGPRHASVGVLLRDRARMHFDLGEWSRAEDLLTKATRILREAMGPEHPEVAESLSLLANVYSAQGRITDAEGLLKEVLAIRSARLGPDHPLVQETIEAYAGILMRAGKMDEANALLDRETSNTD